MYTVLGTYSVKLKYTSRSSSILPENLNCEYFDHYSCLGIQTTVKPDFQDMGISIIQATNCRPSIKSVGEYHTVHKQCLVLEWKRQTGYVR